MPTSTTPDCAPELTDLMKLAGDVVFRASRIEIHAKELFDTAHQLRRHLASKTNLLAGTDDAIERALVLMPNAKAIVDLGVAARELRDVAIAARSEIYARRLTCESGTATAAPRIKAMLESELRAYQVAV